MNNTTHPEVRIRLRIFMEQHGRPVQFDNDNPDAGPSFYGWENPTPPTERREAEKEAPT